MMTGWEIPDLVDCLIKESKGEIAGLQSFLEAYPLAAMSADKKHLVVIRDFSFHATEGKINMMNAMGYGEQSHKGITLVSAGDDGGNQRNVILPNGLGYTEVRLTETQIDIYFGKEKRRQIFKKLLRSCGPFIN